MKKISVVFLVLILIVLNQSAEAQKPKLIAGPIVGSVTKNSAKVWICYKGKGQNALILGDTSDKKIYYPTGYSYIHNQKGEIAMTLDFKGLKPDHQYNILCSIEGWGTNTKFTFRTQADSAIKDVSFLLGSCALLCTGWKRILFPGAADFIFKRMAKKKADFMVWLGDNIYMLGKDYSDYEHMFKRNVSIRKKFKKLNSFLGTQPNYAIWDDHDYGPNDSDKRFALKDSSLKIFKGFWPNTYNRNDSFQGNYFTFRYYDAEFFMTDDRTYRDVRNDSSARMLGETQMIWLKERLILSDATFKFICVGTQVLTPSTFGETYNEYKTEQKELLDFIKKNNIKGVVFLTGDKHFSEISKLEIPGSYPLYDFTCSPITSPPTPMRLVGAYKNDLRVPNTRYGFRNFGMISLSGTTGNRVCTMNIFSRQGRKKSTLTVGQKQLGY